MSTYEIQSIWFRQLTNADFFNIEKTPGTTHGGGGMTYIDLPKTATEALFRFCNMQPPKASGPFPPIELKGVMAIGSPSTSSTLNMSQNRKGEPRYRIENQNRYMPGSQRHPAWTAAFGFPQALTSLHSAEDAKPYLTEGLRVFVVRTLDNRYFAGFVTGKTLPAGWPPQVAPLFADEPGGLLEFSSGVDFLPDPTVQKILDCWSRGKKSVLLYGPPGTGKTRAMNSLWQLLDSKSHLKKVLLDPLSKDRPFQSAKASLPISVPIERDWVTFHQSYTYEDFVVGLRPSPSKEGVSLQPRLGRMLDLAVQLDSNQEGSAVLFIDEINRGNVSRIFGEFITFMDTDYRAEVPGAPSNSMKLPVPLPSVTMNSGKTEALVRPSGGTHQLPDPWYFPSDFFIVASMNSVDRAVAPLDSAINRRFERIEVGPDLQLLALWLDVDINELKETISNRKDEEFPSLSAQQVGWLLLHRINQFISSTLGSEFELGHTYMRPLQVAEKTDADFEILTTIWDREILPQLLDRFASRPAELLSFLKIESPEKPSEYLFKVRTGLLGDHVDGQVQLDPLFLFNRWQQEQEQVRSTLTFLALP